MKSREAAVKNIAPRDLFHAKSPNGASLIYFALEVTNKVIVSQTVTSLYELNFDRKTGVAQRDFHGEQVICTIDSMASLPDDFRKALIDLHQHYSNKKEDDDPALREPEYRALTFAPQYYAANPIALPDQSWEMMSVKKCVGEPSEIREYESLTREEKIDLILVNFLVPANRTNDD